MESFTGAGGRARAQARVRVRRRPPERARGKRQGPTPVEFLLHGLAACLTAGIANIAAARGVTLTEVTSRIEGDIDLLGLLGPVERGAQRLPADPRDVRHQGRRAGREAARDRRAVAGPLGGLRRPHQRRPGRDRRECGLTSRAAAGRSSRAGRAPGGRRRSCDREGKEGVMRRTEAVVIGGGQAGLAMSRCLDGRRRRPRRPRARPRRRAVAQRALGVAPPPHPELAEPSAGLPLRGPGSRRLHDACPRSSGTSSASRGPSSRPSRRARPCSRSSRPARLPRDDRPGHVAARGAS